MHGTGHWCRIVAQGVVITAGIVPKYRCGREQIMAEKSHSPAKLTALFNLNLFWCAVDVFVAPSNFIEGDC
jgi:hypothetical protein